MTRQTRDLCQTCWQDVHPTDYAPLADRVGECVRCGDDAFIARSVIADEVPARHAGHCFEAGTLVCGWPEYHGLIGTNLLEEPPIASRLV